MKTSLAEALEKHVGEKIVVIAARYQYWGILSEIGSEYIIIANAVSVQSGGSAQAEAPQTIDNIGTSIIISLPAVETFYWPKWVNNQLPSES